VCVRPKAKRREGSIYSSTRLPGAHATQEAVITRLLRHLKLAAAPPLSAPPVYAKKRLIGSPNAHDVAVGLRSDVRVAAVGLLSA
jgi:hypothetical protein